MRVEFTRPALIQLGVILDYIREHNPRAADQLSVRFEQAVASIGERPHAGRKQDVEGVRKKIVQAAGCLIFYAINIEAKLVRILAISHPSENRPFSDR